MNKKTRITDTKFWSVLTLAGNAIGLNLLFILACLPIITIGPALCGLYSGVRFMIKKDGAFRGFREGFCTHFIRTGIGGVICVAFQAYVLIQFNTAWGFYQETGMGMELLVTYGVMALLPALIISSLWPLNIYIPGTHADWLRNAVTMLFKAFVPTLIAAVLFLAPVILIWYFPIIAFYGLIIIIGGWFVVSAFVATLFFKDSLIDLLTEYRLAHPEENDPDEGDGDAESF